MTDRPGTTLLLQSERRRDVSRHLVGSNPLHQYQPGPEVPSQHGLGKRRNSVVSEHEDQGSNELDNDDADQPDLPLPDTQLRTSGRIRKRSRFLDGYEIGRG